MARVINDNGRRLRSALFVDFDNVYIGLRRLDPEAAEDRKSVV